MGLVMLDANVAFIAIYAGPEAALPGAAEIFGTKVRGTLKVRPQVGSLPVTGGMGAGIEHYRITEDFPDPPNAPGEFVVGDSIEIATVSLGLVSASVVTWRLRAGTKTTFDLGTCLGLGFSMTVLEVEEVGPR